MRHQFIDALEKALGWQGPQRLGGEFARGTIGDPGLPGRLLTPYGLLDLVMRRSLTAPQLRCFQDGSELHPDRYLDEANVFDPTLEVTCRALQWWSREIVQANAYLTTGEADGFDLHWDDHDVLVFQVAGAKDWEVREASRPFPMYRDAQPNNDPSPETLWRGELTAGQVLHIPRGHWHRATRRGKGDGFSLHLTFGITRRTGVTWLAWLADMARHHQDFRRDLSRQPEDLIQNEALAVEAARLARGSAPASYLRAREDERPSGRCVPHVDALGGAGSVAAETSKSRRQDAA